MPGFRAATPEVIALAVASVALAGLSEELAFRGVLLRLLKPRGIWPAVVTSSVLFGLMHSANLSVHIARRRLAGVRPDRAPASETALDPLVVSWAPRWGRV